MTSDHTVIAVLQIHVPPSLPKRAMLVLVRIPDVLL